MFKRKAHQSAVKGICPTNDHAERDTLLINMQTDLGSSPASVCRVASKSFVPLFMSKQEIESEILPLIAIQAKGLLFVMFFYPPFYKMSKDCTS